MTHNINGIELNNPTIKNVGNEGYKNGDEFINVYADIISDGNLYILPIGKMENTDDWTDEDVMQFATEQLETFKI